jgi:hypothetical protein
VEAARGGAQQHSVILAAAFPIYSPLRQCPIKSASSTGRRNTLSLRKKIDYRPISQRFRGGTRAAEKIALWGSWLRRGSLKAIGQPFGKPSSLFIANWPPVLRRPVEITAQSGQTALETPAGFEPATLSLEGWCSTEYYSAASISSTRRRWFHSGRSRRLRYSIRLASCFSLYRSR